MYGITFASQNNNSSMHTYNICGKNNDSSNLFTLNSNGTGLGSILPNNYVKCSHDKNNLIINYTDEGIRKLTCKQNNSINNGNCYWQVNVRSCDLNEIKNTYSDIINKQLAYGCTSSSCLKDINTIMTTNSKQIRMFAGNNWSKLYTPFKQSTNEGSEVSIKIDITCNYDGTWSIVPNGYIKYEYTGGAQAFTPSKYGITSGKQLTLEVYGAQGGANSEKENNGGKGGYTIGKYTMLDNSQKLYIVTGGQNNYNGGGNVFGGCGRNSGHGGVGGGATHISTISGLITDNNVRNAVLIIAGGGGGGGEDKERIGGAGGGGNNNGEDGIGSYGGCFATGGKINEVGKCSDTNYCQHGLLSKGGDALDGSDSKNNWCGGAGGGGWFGGASGEWGKNCYGSGGGGSGHCGNGVTNCDGENGVREGNGYAKISW